MRTWFGHDPASFKEFARRYVAELEHETSEVAHLRTILLVKAVVTLVYAAKDPHYNQAVVLKAFIEDRGEK